MVTNVASERKNVWPYILWPPIALNVGSLLLIGAMYAVKYVSLPPQSPVELQIGSGQIQFALSILIFTVEWLFALLLLIKYRKAKESIRPLFSDTGNLLQFRWGPAVILFISVNALFAAYILCLMSRMPDLTSRMSCTKNPLKCPFITSQLSLIIWNAESRQRKYTVLTNTKCGNVFPY